ncbi:hypothetical protein EMIHUDRAFT_438356, partial [Emiliania huxleyi CCMP1516]|uniref:Uncharacterized protein n=2 Tax=Emiliania huxleyi TaxID=2903 RepID=A0A0D3IAZ9_EMIH1
SQSEARCARAGALEPEDPRITGSSQHLTGWRGAPAAPPPPVGARSSRGVAAAAPLRSQALATLSSPRTWSAHRGSPSLAAPQKYEGCRLLLPAWLRRRFRACGHAPGGDAADDGGAGADVAGPCHGRRLGVARDAAARPCAAHPPVQPGEGARLAQPPRAPSSCRWTLCSVLIPLPKHTSSLPRTAGEASRPPPRP